MAAPVLVLVIVLHDQGAEPVRLHAVEALAVSAGVDEVHVDGHWPGHGEQFTTAGELRPYPAGAGSGSVDGFAVRFETAGRFEMRIDHRVAVTAAD